MNELPIGEVFEGRYTISAELGRGAFGIVYAATELASQRKVAIKVLGAAALADPQIGRRFDRELQALAGLRDPHTVRLLNYGRREDGGGYLVLEHVPGVDLQVLLERVGALPPHIVRHIARQLLGALREAHSVGLIHRDIKPENIRVFEYQGDPHTVKLLDFGVAKSTDPTATSLTQAGALVGTPRYMSPEQLRGEQVGPASDLYTLGLVLFELACGRDALGGHSLFEQIRRVQEGHELDLPEWLEPQLASVLAKMCALDPQCRYPSAQAVLAALDNAQVLRPSQPAVAPAPAKESGWRWKALAAAAAIGVVAVAAVLASSPDEPPPQPVPRIRAMPAIASSAPTKPEPVAHPVVAVAGMTGCGKPQETGRVEGSVMIGLTSYHWMRYIPSTYDPDVPQPAVFLLPAYHFTAAEFQQKSGFEEAAEKYGMVIVTLESNSDEGIALDLFRTAWVAEQEQLCLDTERMFIVGHGTGGHRAVKLGCEEKNVAGVVSSSARRSGALHCDDPLPMMLMSPLHSPREPVAGGAKCSRSNEKRSLLDYENAWRERNGCSTESVEVFRTKGHKCVDFECDGAPLRQCTVNGGHPWPGTKGPDALIGENCDGPPTLGFPAADIALQFFQQVSEQTDRGVPSNPPRTAK